MRKAAEYVEKKIWRRICEEDILQQCENHAEGKRRKMNQDRATRDFENDEITIDLDRTVQRAVRQRYTSSYWWESSQPWRLLQEPSCLLLLSTHHRPVCMS